MVGEVSYEPPKDCTTQQQLQDLRKDLTKLTQQGGSIARSTALHAACDKNSIKVAKLLLEMDRNSSNTKDTVGRTPLMIAASNAAGRISIQGINDTEIIDGLLALGANKSEVDSVGMTAYGCFRKMSEMMLAMTHYQHRRTITNLEHKLYPPGGPGVIDFAQGRGGNSGFVDYGPEDDQADREMGRGAYADDGDY